MDLGSVFGWFAQESLLAAEVATNSAQREVWLPNPARLMRIRYDQRCGQEPPVGILVASLLSDRGFRAICNFPSPLRPACESAPVRSPALAGRRAVPLKDRYCCRARRRQPSQPSPASSRPGRPAPAMGPGTAAMGMWGEYGKIRNLKSPENSSNLFGESPTC